MTTQPRRKAYPSDLSGLKRIPLGRAADVDEISRPVCFLASDESTSITPAQGTSSTVPRPTPTGAGPRPRCRSIR
ncbi:hypothetical protein ACWD7C_32720 [Streptomyces sp. NPDC005134]|uniref:hypothetical protein n=1 Tax=unclassified Streptomyces TaxID=2593676 RepID=UPI0033A6784C